jgi:hypothetical protein
LTGALSVPKDTGEGKMQKWKCPNNIFEGNKMPEIEIQATNGTKIKIREFYDAADMPSPAISIQCDGSFCLFETAALELAESIIKGVRMLREDMKKDRCHHS